MKKYIWHEKDGLYGVELCREIPLDGERGCYGGMIFWFKTTALRSLFLIYSDNAETDKLEWKFMSSSLRESVEKIGFHWDLNDYDLEQ
jgi:hypothetical protein